jgi:ribonuclease Z
MHEDKMARNALASTAVVLATSILFVPVAARSQNGPFRAVLLGTGTPVASTVRLGPSTLIEAGVEKLVFDVGRDVIVRLDQVGIPYAALSGILLTHLHSDHVSGLPDLWLTGRFGPAGKPVREGALDVWGPVGTDAMVSHLAEAYKFDLAARPRLTPPQGVLAAHEIAEGTVFNRNGVTVTAFLVSHGNVIPAFGYRIDYGGRRIVLSGDATFNERLIENSAGADLLIYEVAAATESVVRPDVARALSVHISPEEAGTVFARVRPKLAVYSHILTFGVSDDELLTRTRKTFAGRIVVGADLMSVDVGEAVTVTPFATK